MSSETQAIVLWYFADPMCSWCWGFSPVIEKIRSHYGERLKVALMLGGLRPGTTEPMSDLLRDEILHHWHEVQKKSGQDFNFDDALPRDFIYDTEPASRAVVTMAELNPEQIFLYFKSIQSAFYVEQRDVTKEEVLVSLADQLGVDFDSFRANFKSDEARRKTQQHFQGSRQAGVSGFPSLVLQMGNSHEFITRGYCSFDEIKFSIDNWMIKI